MFLSSLLSLPSEDLDNWEHSRTIWSNFSYYVPHSFFINSWPLNVCWPIKSTRVKSYFLKSLNKSLALNWKGSQTYLTDFQSNFFFKHYLLCYMTINRCFVASNNFLIVNNKFQQRLTFWTTLFRNVSRKTSSPSQHTPVFKKLLNTHCHINLGPVDLLGCGLLTRYSPHLIIISICFSTTIYFTTDNYLCIFINKVYI